MSLMILMTFLGMLPNYPSLSSICHYFLVTIFQCFMFQALQRSYEAVVKSPAFDILKAIFMSASGQRFTLAKTFIRSNGLKDVEVTNLECVEYVCCVIGVHLFSLKNVDFEQG